VGLKKLKKLFRKGVDNPTPFCYNKNIKRETSNRKENEK
jgi:hypothetical protein